MDGEARATGVHGGVPALPQAVGNGRSEPPEWWEVLAARWARWQLEHPQGAGRLARVTVTVAWASLGWLLVLLIWRSEVRESVGVAISVYWLLGCWFWLTRTRTLSWQAVSALYAACIPWSIAVSFLTHRLATSALSVGGLPGDVNAFGPATMVAGLGEEAAKLLPLAVLAIAAPGRVRRFAVTDWLLAGFACGLAFQLAEELARRTAVHVIRPGLFDLLLGRVSDRSAGSGFAQYGLSPFGGWSNWTAGTQFPGHHATTALVAACVGLGIAAWRHAGRHGGGASIGPVPSGVLWRVLGVASPLVMFWLVVSVHAGGNATASVGDAWVEAENPSMPWSVRVGWAVANHGVGLRWLLVLLLIAAVLVDARHLRDGDRPDTGGTVLAVPFVPAARAAWWVRRSAAPEHAWWRPAAAGFLLAGAYLWRDLQFLLQAHQATPGEPRRAAIARGRVAMRVVRQARAEGITRALPAARGGRVVVRVVGVVAAGGLLAAILWWAPHLAAGVGTGPEAVAGEWFARLLDALGDWWNGLSPAAKIGVGAGIAALFVLSGGSFGLALGASGAGTYLLDHAHGAAAFTRDPRAATRDYLATTTPLGVVADVGEGVLTFLPGNFAGAAGGTLVRNGVRAYARDPDAWWAAQRALRHDERGVIDLAAFYRREPIELADGTTWAARTPQESAAMREWLDTLPTRDNVARDAAGDYQSRLYGGTEHDVGTGKQVWTDGTTPDYAAIADAKLRSGGASSWYDPSTMSGKVREFAVREIDDRLIKYAEVLESPANPARVLELTTNDPGVAGYLEGRLRALNIPGYVRLEP